MSFWVNPDDPLEVGDAKVWADKMRTARCAPPAALLRRTEKPDGNILKDCCHITAALNDIMMPIHDRMPVIVAPDDDEAWLVVN